MSNLQRRSMRGEGTILASSFSSSFMLIPTTNRNFFNSNTRTATLVGVRYYPNDVTWMSWISITNCKSLVSKLYLRMAFHSLLA